MKWRKNKPSSSSSSSSRFPSLSRVLPTAWLSSFKRMNIHSEANPAKEKQNEMKKSCMSTKFAAAAGDADDAFWRLSFGEYSADGKTSKTVSRSAWYGSDDELDFAPSNCRTCGSNAMRIKEKEEAKTCKFRRDTEILPHMNIYKREKTPRMEKDLKLKKKAHERVRGMEEKRLNRQYKSGEAQHRSARSVEKKSLEMEPVRTVPIIERENLNDYQRKHQYPSTRASNLTTIKEDYAFKAHKLLETRVFSPEEVNSSSEGEKWKEEKQKKSVYMSRESPRRRVTMKQNNKVRVFSPKTASRVEICKIKALEDMKKAKLKIRAAKQKPISQRTELENFAVVKCSFDPEKDFRDSMMEMIRENWTTEAEDLEELLACYLTLNSDAYHDLIIKVFQQVWFDLDQPSSELDLQNQN